MRDELVPRGVLDVWTKRLRYLFVVACVPPREAVLIGQPFLKILGSVLCRASDSRRLAGATRDSLGIIRQAPGDGRCRRHERLMAHEQEPTDVRLGVPRNE